MKPVMLIIGKLLFIQANCKHSTLKPFLEPFEHIQPKLFGWLVRIWIFILLVALHINIYLLISICTMDEAECLVLTSNSILIIVCILMSLKIGQIVPDWVNELNKLPHLLDELMKEDILLKDFEKFSVKYCHMFKINFIFIIIHFLLLFLMCIWSIKQRGLVCIIPEIVLFIVINIETWTVLIMSIEINIMKDILKLKEMHFCHQMVMGKNVEMSIEEFRKSVSCVHSFWRQIIKLMKPLDVISLLFVISMMILNVYYLVVESKVKNPERLFVSYYHFFTSVTIMAYFLCTVDSNEMVSSMS